VSNVKQHIENYMGVAHSVDGMIRDALTEIKRLEGELKEMQRSEELYQKCVQRAEAYWQEKTGNPLVLPDTTDLMKWLMDELAVRDEALRRAVRGGVRLSTLAGHPPTDNELDGVKDYSVSQARKNLKEQDNEKATQ